MLNSLQILDSKEDVYLRSCEEVKDNPKFNFNVLPPSYIVSRGFTLNTFGREAYKPNVIKVNYYPASDRVRVMRFKCGYRTSQRVDRTYFGYEGGNSGYDFPSWYSQLDSVDRQCENKARALRRALSKTTDYVLSNFWDYWCTFTFDELKVDRYSRDDCYKVFYNVVKAVNRKYKSDLKFLVFPEKHEDGAWHLHGFMSNIPKELFFINDNNYLDLHMFCDNGFVSLENLNSNCEKARRKKYYACKYAQKSAESYSKYEHIYYCSRGLCKSDSVLVEPETNALYNFDLYGALNSFIDTSDDVFENDYIVQGMYFASVFFDKLNNFYKVVKDYENSWIQTVQLHE